MLVGGCCVSVPMHSNRGIGGLFVIAVGCPTVWVVVGWCVT